MQAHDKQVSQVACSRLKDARAGFVSHNSATSSARSPLLSKDRLCFQEIASVVTYRRSPLYRIPEDRLCCTQPSVVLSLRVGCPSSSCKRTMTYALCNQCLKQHKQHIRIEWITSKPMSVSSGLITCKLYDLHKYPRGLSPIQNTPLHL